LAVYLLPNLSAGRNMYDVRYYLDLRKRFQNLWCLDPSFPPNGLAHVRIAIAKGGTGVIAVRYREGPIENYRKSAKDQSDARGSVGYLIWANVLNMEDMLWPIMHEDFKSCSVNKHTNLPLFDFI